MDGVRGFLDSCSHGKSEIYVLVHANTNKIPKLAEVSAQGLSGTGAKRG